MGIYRNHNVDGEFMHDEYMKHLSAMTTEKLHSKSDIAYELAHRDVLLSDVMAYCKRKCVEAAMNSGITQDQCAYIQGTIIPAIEKIK